MTLLVNRKPRHIKKEHSIVGYYNGSQLASEYQNGDYIRCIENPIHSIIGVWLATDTKRDGTNYCSNRTLTDSEKRSGLIKLDSTLADGTEIIIDYNSQQKLLPARLNNHLELETSKDQIVEGCLYIPIGTGGAGDQAKNLFDSYTESDSGQDLADEAPESNAVALYIPLYPSDVEAIKITQLYIGYKDEDGSDQLSAVYLYSGKSEEKVAQASKMVFSKTTGLTETTLTAPGNPSAVNIETALEHKGRLYFQTTWGTILNVDKAGEFFFIKVVGTKLNRGY